MNSTVDKYIEKYGTIKLNIKKIMDKKNISISEMSKMTGLKYDIVKKYYLGNCYQLDLATLSKFCHVLNCDIVDILKYTSGRRY